MTSTVKVIAHNDPCLVTLVDMTNERVVREVLVEVADGEFSIHCTQTLAVHVRDVSKDFKLTDGPRPLSVVQPETD